MEFDKCEFKQLVSVDGFIEKGKQFDVEITVPEDNRNVIYGLLKNQYHEPLKDAIVKLIEVSDEYGKKDRKPVSHTFTDKNGEFVFGPLCPDKKYEIQIWYNAVKHIKVCEDCSRKQECLKGVELGNCHKSYEKEYMKELENKYDDKLEEKKEKKHEILYPCECSKK